MSFRKAFKKLLFCNQYCTNNTILLASSPRSGSTWLAQAWHELGYDLVNEPLFLSRYPEVEKAGFEWRTYIAPSSHNLKQYSLMERLLAGGVGYVRPSKGILGYVPTLKYFKECKLIIKCVRANRMLAWITEEFPIKGVILLVRHPCAVVSSQIAMGERQDSPWKYLTKERERSASNLYGGKIPDFIQEKFHAGFEKIKTRAGYLAAVWALDNVIPLLIHPPSRTALVSYELLLKDPIAEFERIRSELQLPNKRRIPRGWANPSYTASPDLQVDDTIAQISKWKTQLTDDEIDEVLNVVKSFGVDFYSDDPMPNIKFFQAWGKSV